MKLRIFTLLAIIATVFSSCFDITERISYKKDGSGHADYITDLTKMMDMMKAYAPDSIKNAEDGMNQMFDDLLDSLGGGAMADQVAKMKTVKGIKNAQIKKEGFKVMIAFDFDNAEALNTAFNIIGSTDSTKTMNESIFTGNKNTFTRTDFASTLDFLKQSGALKPDETAMLEMMLAGGHYVQEYTFEHKVKSVSNTAFAISTDQKTVSRTNDLKDVLTGAVKPGTTVELK